MIQELAPQTPFRQQLIPSITQGLSATKAAAALHLTRQAINAARRSTSYSSDNMFPPSTPNILTTKYPLHVKRPRKIKEKHEAVKWLKDNLPVKSGSKTETYTQHDHDYQLYNRYKKDKITVNMSKPNNTLRMHPAC
jgi:hypothetical protein